MRQGLERRRQETGRCGEEYSITSTPIVGRKSEEDEEEEKCNEKRELLSVSNLPDCSESDYDRMYDISEVIIMQGTFHLRRSRKYKTNVRNKGVM